MEALSDEEFNELFRWASSTELKRVGRWQYEDASRIHDMVLRLLYEVAYREENTGRKRIVNQEVQT